MAAPNKSQILTATYNSPTNAPFKHTQTIPNPSTQSTQDKTAYLSSLRKAREVLQEKINQELTARMEEDNLKAAAMGDGGKSGGVDDGKEEENYGEEVVEED